jgi:isopentenyl-diphosphate Delta-isomerase
MDDIVLVDADGHAMGSTTKVAAHRAPGVLHRAFSVMLVDDDGLLVLQQRAHTKYHFAGLWANSCCGHPRPGEQPVAAAARRTAEELGVEVIGLQSRGAFVYRAVDTASGLVEHEYDEVFVGSFRGPLRPDPGEAEAVRSVSLEELLSGLRDLPADFAPWLPGVMERLVATGLPTQQARGPHG